MRRALVVLISQFFVTGCLTSGVEKAVTSTSSVAGDKGIIANRWSRGRIQTVAKNSTLSDGAQGAFFFHDIDLLPGMSGGPIFDAAGRLVAIQQGVEKTDANGPFIFDNYKYIIGIPFDELPNP